MDKLTYVRGALGLMLALGWLAACSDDPAPKQEESNNSSGGPCTDDLECSVGRYCIDGECVVEGSECFSDAECEGEEVCRGGYCTSPAPQCAEDGECAAGSICEGSQCQVGCRDDAGCSDGQVCDLASLRCEDPEIACDAECPAHQTCDTRTGECVADGTCTTEDDCTGDLTCEEGRCVAPVERCESNAECDPGTICDLETSTCVEGCRLSNECPSLDLVCYQGACVPPPACDADEAEPNQAREEASSLLAGARLEGLTLCGDEDWYAFRAFANDEVTVEIAFEHDDGNLSLQLVDPDGNVLQLSATEGDAERIQRSVNRTGTHYLRVFGAGRGIYTTYDLSFDRLRTCAADRMEPNEAPAAATPLPQATTAEGSLTICEGDVDWFAVPLYAGESLTASIAFARGEGELGLALYDAAGETLLASSTSGEDREEVTFEATTPQVVLLQVSGGVDVINAYDLAVEATPRACAQEEPERSDEPASGDLLAFGEAASGTICAGDADWFTLVTPADATLSLTLDHAQAEGDLSLEVYAPDGVTLLASAASMQDGETLEFNADVPGALRVRVFGAGRSQASYTLTATSDATAACPGDDALEENDTLPAASLLTPGVTRDLILCGGDEDWITFDLAEGQSFQLFALAPAELGALSLQLYNPAGDAVDAPVTGEAAIKRLQQQLGATPGRWSVQIQAERGEAVPYSLRLFVYEGRLPLECPDDDTLEDNDRPADAQTLAFNTTQEAILCPGDMGGDWFRVNAAAGDALNVRLDYSLVDANLDLRLLDSSGAQVVAEAATERSGEDLRFIAPTAGLYFVQVVLNGESEAGAVYGLTVSRGATTARATCVTDDLYEQNDTLATASVVEPGAIAALRCGADVDFYALDVDPGDVLRATLLHDGGPDALELTLLDSTNTTLATAPATGDASRTLEYTTAVGERLTWRVSGAAPGDLAYTLRLERLNDQLTCGDPDALEPNDAPALATPSSVDAAWPALAACGADQDWWSLEVPDGLQAVVEATFDPEAGNLDLVAYDVRGDGAAESLGTSGVERLVLPAEDADARYWVVAARADQEPLDLTYDLTVRYEETRLACFEDEFEPNNSDAEAPTIAADTYNLGFCAGEEDWFVVTLGMFESITATIEFDGDAADLGLELIDPASFFPIPTVSDEGGDVEEVTTISLFGGPVFLRVFSTDPDASAPYTLTVEVGAGF